MFAVNKHRPGGACSPSVLRVVSPVPKFVTVGLLVITTAPGLPITPERKMMVRPPPDVGDGGLSVV